MLCTQKHITPTNLKFRGISNLEKLFPCVFRNKVILDIWRRIIFYGMMNISICELCLKTSPSLSRIFNPFFLQPILLWIFTFWNSKMSLQMQYMSYVVNQYMIIKYNKVLYLKYLNISPNSCCHYSFSKSSFIFSCWTHNAN